MNYEWDEAKRRDTLEQRSIDFADMSHFEWDTAIHRRRDRQDEVGWASLGYISGRLHHVVWTERGDNVRIISLRIASVRERRDYEHAGGH